MPERQALVGAVVAAGSNIAITRLAKDCAHRFPLLPAVFQQHQTAGSQEAAAFANDVSQIGETAIGGVVGVPVGFVGAAESKAALSESGLPAIAALGRKGGSNVAAAIVNALLYHLREAQ